VEADAIQNVVFLDVSAQFGLDNPPNEFDNGPWVGSANVSRIAASFGRLPLPVSAAPPGGPPFLAPFLAAPKAMVGLCLFPMQENVSWERSCIVAI
jgi:hypothetical protein